MDKPEEKPEKLEVAPDVPKEPEQQLGWTVEGKCLVCRVPIDNPHVAMGITMDFLFDIRDRLSFSRLAAEKKRQELAGGNSMKKGAVQNQSWFKKKFK